MSNKTLNFNIGVLGHVDSGKTSLAKALSTVASTACFDKNPQSKQRGITLDLGFSSFTVPASEQLHASHNVDNVQYTLVDCPGHASLIKTIIGGAQIIDMMMLIVDIQKGMQTQTAECLIIGEICCEKMLVVLNKLDLIEESKRDEVIDKVSKRLLKTLETTRFANSPIVAVAANSSSSSSLENAVTAKLQLTTDKEAQQHQHLNVDKLIETLREMTFYPVKRSESGPLLFAVDHCFAIRGQGTVLTGTVLNGSVKINDSIEIPSLKVEKRVKSIQIFRKPVDKAIQGDRCGICVTNLDAKELERGLACSPGHVKTVYGVILRLNKIRHYKGLIETGAKFHITIGHETLLGKIELFGTNSEVEDADTFDFSKEYLHLHEYQDVNKANQEEEQTKKSPIKVLYALIDFSDHSCGVLCVPNSLLIGSKLDTDIHLNQCRIAFYGRVSHSFTNKDFRDNAESDIAKLRVYKEKSKEGLVERMQDEQTIIGKSLFKKDTNVELFAGLKVTLSTGEQGTIEGNFGQSGKFKIRIPNGLLPSTQEQLGAKASKKKQQQGSVDQTEPKQPIKIFLNFKKFIYGEKKRIVQ